MVEKTVEEKDSYRLSEDKRENLISGLRETADGTESTALSDLSAELERAKRNAEKQRAWVSAIVPPSADSDEAPNRGNQIAVEFLLPSEDTFWETYDIKKSYISDEDDFVKLVNHIGYDVNALEYVVGEQVDVVYDESRESWMVDPEIFGNEEDDEEINVKSKLQYAVLSFVGLVLSVPLLVIIVRTRGLALLFIGAVIAVLYFLDASLS